MITKNKPDFESILGMCIIPLGYKGVKRRFGNIVGVIEAGMTTGIPGIHDIALVPVTPGTVSDLEQQVRSKDNRSVGVRSDSTFIVDDPIKFLDKAPDDYLTRLVPKIEHTLQTVAGENYTSHELIEKSNQLSGEIKDQLNQTLKDLDWGITCNLFRYLATTDPADLISGDADKLRAAELRDAKAKKGVAITIAEMTAKVSFIARKYDIDANVYALRSEGEALAGVLRQTGMAETDVLERKIDVYYKALSKVITQISQARKTMEKEDAEILLAFTLAPLEGMLTGSQSSGAYHLKEQIMSRISERVRGQASGRYVQASSQTGGVNPNVALIASVLPDALEKICKGKG